MTEKQFDRLMRALWWIALWLAVIGGATIGKSFN